MPIIRIVSGGQTGADRGGLEAAVYCDVTHRGSCPKGRKAEDGVIPRRYRHREMDSDGYLVRTEANVLDSEATVIFTANEQSGGSLKTVEFCMKHTKPWIHAPAAVKAIKPKRSVAQEWIAPEVTTRVIE